MLPSRSALAAHIGAVGMLQPLGRRRLDNQGQPLIGAAANHASERVGKAGTARLFQRLRIGGAKIAPRLAHRQSARPYSAPIDPQNDVNIAQTTALPFFQVRFGEITRLV